MQSEGPGFKSDPATHSVTLGKFLQVSEPHIPSSVKWAQWSVSACSPHDACAMDACCYNYLPCPPALPSVPASQWVATPFTCPVTQARRWSLKEPLLPHASQYCWFFLGDSSCICCLSFFPVRAKSLESYPTLLWPYGLYPARLLCPRGFSRQEYWSGLPFSSPGDLPNPGIELVCPEAPVCRRILYRWSDCKVKIPPAILISKKCHSHQRFLAFKGEWGFPILQSTGCCRPPPWLLRSWGNARSKVNKETGLPRRLRCIWKERIQRAQRLASSPTQNPKFLHLIPDLWRSDCLLPLLQTCI